MRLRQLRPASILAVVFAACLPAGGASMPGTGAPATGELPPIAPAVGQDAVVVTADIARGWQSVEVDVPAPSPTERSPRELCDGRIPVTSWVPLVLDVRDRPTVLRVGADDAFGFAIQAAEGRVYCTEPVHLPARVQDIHVVLGVGRHEVYVRRMPGKLRARIRWSPVFAPSEEQVAAWIARYPDVDAKGKRPNHPPHFRGAMGAPLVIPLRDGYCYRFHMVHRPAAPLDHATRFVTFLAKAKLQTGTVPRYLEEDDRDGDVGWMARSDVSCAAGRSTYVVTTSYLDGHPADPGDQLEVRAYVWKRPKDPPRTRDDIARDNEFDCNSCLGVFNQCRARGERDCTGGYRRCLRFAGVTRKICGDP